MLAENFDSPFVITAINKGISQMTHAEKDGNSQSRDMPNNSKKPKFVHFKTHTAHETEQPKKQSPKKMILDAVFVPKRPPFSPSKIPPRRREPESESESEQQGKNISTRGKLNVDHRV